MTFAVFDGLAKEAGLVFGVAGRAEVAEFVALGAGSRFGLRL